jgi:ATP-dependent DNA helicase RecG
LALRGVQRVFEACRQAGAPAPEVECEGGEVRFELPFAPSYLQALAASPETSGKTRERILATLHQRSQTTIPELAEELGKSTRAVEMAISKLTKEKMLRRIGPAKGGRWEVIKR